MLDVHMIITTVLLYKYIILLGGHLYQTKTKTIKQVIDKVIDKLQLYGDNVILLKLDNTLLIGFILIIIYILA